MRCPKCKLLTFEGNTTCPRCGEDLSALARRFGPFYQFTVDEVILKDTLLTAPPFISPPEEIPKTTSPPEGMPDLTEVISPDVREETAHPGETSSSPGEAEIFQELAEALREDQG